MDDRTERAHADIEELSTRLDGDESLILTLLKVFERNCRVQLDMLDAAMEGKDVRLAVRAVHTIAEASGKASVRSIRESAERMEDALSRGDPGEARKAFESLKSEFEAFSGWLTAGPDLTRTEA